MPNHEVAVALGAGISALAATSHRGINVTEVHDFFTAVAPISYEGRGFAEQWGDCKIVEAEVTSTAGTYL